MNAIDYERIWIDGLNRRDVSTADEVFAPNCIIHLGGDDLTVAKFKEAVLTFLDSFPDLHISIEDQFVLGDKAAFRWTAKGTHTGCRFHEVEPKGKQVKYVGLIVDHLVDGRVAERWEQFDEKGILKQLGSS